MRQKRLNKRSSCPGLDPVTRQPSAARPRADDKREYELMKPVLLKSRSGSLRVLSEIRGAIRAIKRTPYTLGSDGPAVDGWNEGHLSAANVDQRHFDGGVKEVCAQTMVREPTGLAKRLCLENVCAPSDATVVLRGDTFWRRTSLPILPSSPAKAIGNALSSISSHGTDKSSAAGNDSTRKTSIDSKISESMSAKSSPKRRRSRRHPWSKSSPDGGTLQTIDEGSHQPQPTIITVERASAAKVYLETHFNAILNKSSSRNARLQYLEAQLYYSPHLNTEEKDLIRRSFYFQESCHSREMRAIKVRSLLSLTDDQHSQADRYDCLKVLGRGSFGVVKLVREKADNAHAYPEQVFAMKVIRKSEMIRSCQEGHLRAERDVLVASEGSDWIVPLVTSFEDLTSLYLVMEYMPGGDFLGLLIRENILHESVARFYVAEMILAVEEAHRLRFIHRDIKPDNFLISATGHLKISDFGLAFDGHWSHDATYHSCQRYSLLGKLGIRVDGDADDQKKTANISSQIPWLQAMKYILDRHERKRVENDDLPRLLN